VLFTGDHLACSAGNQALTGFRAYNHGSVAAQAESLQLLTSEDLNFDVVLPGIDMVDVYLSYQLGASQGGGVRCCMHYRSYSGRRASMR
jgi:hypothetical protein